MKTFKLAPKTRTFAVVSGGFLLLALLLLLGGSFGRRIMSAEIVSSAGERVAFLEECGWTVDPLSEQEQQIQIPVTFSPVYESYNELQRQQGYDFTPYAGQDCTLYTYTVTNYPDASQTVVADLYILRDRIIGGDVHSTNLNGFMVGLK